MAYEPLHHKYRPQTFGDLVGQEAIATTLTNAILQSRIAPAYLFSGPRGTGKTSSARILAKSLNCQAGEDPTPTPCGACEACRSIVAGSALDVIEIDAASNTGVDNIRELIEKAQFAPVQCRFKVYVIDECHMLSTAAFNALLKTLEEPPDRVVFVLATTDPQRVLPTIISRCQRFDYRRIPLESMVSHLRFIADEELIDIEQDALTLVAQIAQGGLRDAESLLDQLSLLPPPTNVEAVWDLVGAVPERDLLALAEAIAANTPEPVIDRARHLMNRGREPLIVLQNLASFYRDLLIAKTAPQRNDLVAITASTWDKLTTFVESIDIATLLHGQEHLRTSEVQLKNTTQPRLWLEVTLLGLLPSAQSVAAPSVAPAAIAPPPSAPASTPPPPPATPSPPPAAPAPTTSPPPTPPSSAPAPAPVSVPSPPAPPTVVQQGSGLGGSAPSNIASGNAANNQAELAELWKRIVASVEYRSTQMLLRQQGRLLKLTDKAARVGINERWMGNLQGKLPAIEAAFARTTGKPLKVTLEAVAPQVEAAAPPVPLTPAASTEAANDPASAPPAAPSVSMAPTAPAPVTTLPPTPPPTPQSPVTQPPVTPPATPPVAQSPPDKTTPTSQSSPASPTVPPAPTALAQPPSATSPISPQSSPPPSSQGNASAPISSPVPNTEASTAELAPVGQLLSNMPEAGPGANLQAPGLADWDEGELLRAAKSLAQFFNGEVVAVEGDVEGDVEDAVGETTESEAAVSVALTASATQDVTPLPVTPLPTPDETVEDDDDDVPF